MPRAYPIGSPVCSRPIRLLVHSYFGPCLSYTGSMHPPVRLVAIDMDGTLLPALSQIMSARTGRSLVAAQAAGITVVIATGRRLAYTLPLIENLGLRADTPLITSN